MFFSIFTQWLEDIGLTNTMAKWLLSRKFLSGKPYVFIFMLFLVTFLCGFFVGIYATIFLMWGICYRMLQDMGFKRGSKESSFILIGVAFVSIMGMTVKPWSPWAMVGVNGLRSVTGEGVVFLPYSCFMVVISLASTLLFMLFAKLILRLDMSVMKDKDFTGLAKEIQVTKQEKLGAVMLILLLVALYIPSVLPDGLIKTMLSAQGATGLCIIMLLVLSFVYFDGKPAIDFVELAKKSIPWNMVCLLTAVGPVDEQRHGLYESDHGDVEADHGWPEPNDVLHFHDHSRLRADAVHEQHDPSGCDDADVLHDRRDGWRKSDPGGVDPDLRPDGCALHAGGKLPCRTGV